MTPLLIARKVAKTPWPVEGAYPVAKAMLARPDIPDAVVCACDTIAIGAMRAVRRRGWCVPDDVSVIGFDDIHFAEFTEPPLTTVALSRRELAEKAIYALLQHVEPRQADAPAHGAEYTVTPTLVVRQSTSRPAGR